MSRPDIPPNRQSPADPDPGGLPVAWSCWGVTDGRAGMEIQCLVLAEALGLEPQVKRVSVGKPWRWLPAGLIRQPLNTLGPKGDRLAPPWPDLWIASGRQTVPLTRDLRHLSGGRSFTVPIQNPAIDPAAIHLILTPQPYRLRAANVPIGRAHVCTPVTNAHLVCRPLLEKKNKTT